MTVIAIPAAGAMGAGLGRVLVAHGATVLTLAHGRSSATLARAADAGMQPADLAQIAAADLILSVAPPAIAQPLAQDIAAALPSGHRPIYADLNAISPGRVDQIARIVTAAGADFVDGGIIGFPPRPDGARLPLIYLSGPAEAAAAALLTRHGLTVQVIGGGIGAASALKMCYGAMTKGLTGLTAAMLLAAERAGIAPALHAELSRSQPALLTRAASALPDMYPKAYRWVDEMDQIAAFLGPDRPEAQIWQGLAGLYQALADDPTDEDSQIAALERFLSLGDTADGNSRGS